MAGQKTEPEAVQEAAEGLSPELQAILGAVLEQNALMARQLAALQSDVSAREVAAAEAAASKKLPPAHTDVEEGFEPVTFRSKGVEFRVVRVGRHKWTAPNGESQTTEGRDYQFAAGPIGLSELVVRNSDVAAWLRARPSFNREFWEVGAEPFSAPDPEIILKQIQAALFEADDAALEELLTKELASHKRKVVLDAARHARRLIQGRGD